MLMHRSVPRTHTSTARGGRMGPRLRGYWTRVLKVLKGGGARTHGLTKRTERVRTYLGIATRRVLRGYSRRTHGPVRGTICAGQWKGTWGALATATNRARAREGVLQTIPSTHGAAPLRGLLPAYSRPRAARARARQCDGACGRMQWCSRTPTGGRSHAGAQRGMAHGAGAQDAQQVERRQRGGDRAVQRVRVERPATCMVRPEPLCSEMLMHRSVPRTPTSTARGGRMGLRPRGYCKRVLEGVLNACAGDERYVGALEDTNGQALARTRAASRARRAHRKLSSLSADSESGIVPSSEL
jgi:hypothetical protein